MTGAIEHAANAKFHHIVAVMGLERRGWFGNQESYT